MLRRATNRLSSTMARWAAGSLLNRVKGFRCNTDSGVEHRNEERTTKVGYLRRKNKKRLESFAPPHERKKWQKMALRMLFVTTRQSSIDHRKENVAAVGV